MKQLRLHIIRRLQLRESWLIFFILGIMLMTFPILHIFNKPVLMLGVPLLFLYLTTGWIVSIIVIYLFVAASRTGTRKTNERDEP